MGLRLHNKRGSCARLHMRDYSTPNESQWILAAGMCLLCSSRMQFFIYFNCVSNAFSFDVSDIEHIKSYHVVLSLGYSPQRDCADFEYIFQWGLVDFGRCFDKSKLYSTIMNCVSSVEDDRKQNPQTATTLVFALNLTRDFLQVYNSDWKMGVSKMNYGGDSNWSKMNYDFGEFFNDRYLLGNLVFRWVWLCKDCRAKPLKCCMI